MKDPITIQVRQERQDAFEDRVRRLQAQGISINEIARRVGLPSSTMYRWVKGGNPRGGEQYDRVMAELGFLTGQLEEECDPANYVRRTPDRITLGIFALILVALGGVGLLILT